MTTTSIFPTERIQAIFSQLESHVESHMDKYLKRVDSLWQPSDHSPDISDENENLAQHRLAAPEVTIEQLIVLVGNTITEDALPTYSASLSRLVEDKTGISDNPLAVAARRWEAEERRHGSLLDQHLRIDRRVNMKKVEETINYLIQDGFTTGGMNPVEGFVYTSFQERATHIAHKKLGQLIGKNNPFVSNSCRIIADDEARHEGYYKTVLLKKIFEIDPEVALAAYYQMMFQTIKMPALRMRDSPIRKDGETLFDQFSKVAQKIGVYTSEDYISIVEHLNSHWGIEAINIGSETSSKQRDRLVTLPQTLRRAAKRKQSADYKIPQFSWIRDN